MNINSSSNTTAAPTSYGYYQKSATTSSATPVSPAPSSPYKVIDIGTQFCKQYYRMLSVEPEAGYKFYSKMSHLTHGVEGNLEVPMCYGLEEIQQRILSMGFAGCRVFISTIDCQASLQGGVVVVVIGRMQMMGGVLRKFVQSIFLAEQPTGFFVLNDVFRFIEEDEAPSPIQLPHHQPAVATAAPAVAAPVAPAVAVATVAAAPVAPVAATTTTTSTTTTAVQPIKTEQTWGDSAWNIDAPTPSVSASTATTVPSPAKQQPIKKPDTTKQAPVIAKEEPVNPAVVESPSSWAAVTVDHQSKWGNGMVSGAKGTSVAAPAKTTTTATTTGSSEPRHFKSRHGQKTTAETATNETTSTTTTNQSNNNNNNRPRRQFNESYNAEASIFVGNVKSRVEESVIREAFSGYGTIKNVEIARECLFVEFETVESARKAISTGTVKLHNHEYKVDKRRPPRTATGSTGTTSNNNNNQQRPRFQTRNPRPRQQQEGGEEKKL